MIYLVHGENIADSRRYLIRLKSTYQETLYLKGKGLNKKILDRYIYELSQNLFNLKSVLLIENFDGDFSIFSQSNSQKIDLILWSSKKIEKIPQDIKDQQFNQRNTVNSFKLADAVFYRNEKIALALLGTLLQKKEPLERILGSLNRGLYLLYFEKKGQLQGNILPAFVREKISDQERGWTKAKIRKALWYLLKADLDIKRGLNQETSLYLMVSKIISI